MPAAISHYLHACKVKSNINYSNLDSDAFFWGAQGPDFFFCHRYLPWMKGNNYRDVGDQLHQADPNKLLSAMISLCEESEIQKSYFFGFVCHYIFDSNAHPYINRKSEILLETHPLETLNTLHNEIESAIDTILLRFETGELPGDKKISYYTPLNERVMREIADFWNKVFLQINWNEISSDKIYEAEMDTVKVFSLLTDKFGLKKQFISRLERGRAKNISCHIRPLLESMDEDFANSEEIEWGENGENSDLFSIYETAISKASVFVLALIKKEADADNISIYTENRKFG